MFFFFLFFPFFFKVLDENIMVILGFVVCSQLYFIEVLGYVIFSSLWFICGSTMRNSRVLHVMRFLVIVVF